MPYLQRFRDERLIIKRYTNKASFTFTFIFTFKLRDGDVFIRNLLLNLKQTWSWVGFTHEFGWVGS